MKKYLEYKDDKSAKFWEIDVQDKDVIVRFGKIGTNGQTKTKQHDSSENAAQEALKLINQKTEKGYCELVSHQTESNKNSSSNIKKIWKRLINWFSQKQPEYIKGLNDKGATNKEIIDFEKKVGHKLSDSFKEFYSQHNGWNYCNIDFIESFLSLSNILETISVLSDFPEFDNYIPFTTSARGRDHYCINMNKDGEIVLIATDDDDIEVEAPSFDKWIEQLTADLEAGEFDEYFDEIE